MHSRGVGRRRHRSVGVLILGSAVMGSALTGCSSGGTVAGPGKPSGSRASSTVAVAESPGPTTASGGPGSPASSSAQDVTVTQAEAASVLKTYQGQNNAANAALDTAAMAKIESGSLLSLDQATLIYDQGVGGDRAKQAETPMTFTNPVFYPVGSTTYPRAFFVTTDGVQSGSPTISFLMHFTQDHAGAPWLADTLVNLGSGQQWPAFAVGPNGVLDYNATKQTQLPLNTTDLAAADRTMLADGDAGQPASPFLNDDVTAAEQRWIQGENDDVSPATVALTVTTALSPLPTYVPLEDGGELVLYGTRLSLRVSQSGRTFTFGDQGWAKVAGTDGIDGGFTVDSVWMAAAIDPPDKSAKIQKIAHNGGLVAVH